MLANLEAPIIRCGVNSDIYTHLVITATSASIITIASAIVAVTTTAIVTIASAVIAITATVIAIAGAIVTITSAVP